VCPAATDIRHLSIYVSEENLRDSFLINWILLRPDFQNGSIQVVKINQQVRDCGMMVMRYVCLFAACFINKDGNELHLVDPAEHVCYLLILAVGGDVVLVFKKIRSVGKSQMYVS
jgi:hypothetical protein